MIPKNILEGVIYKYMDAYGDFIYWSLQCDINGIESVKIHRIDTDFRMKMDISKDDQEYYGNEIMELINSNKNN